MAKWLLKTDASPAANSLTARVTERLRRAILDVEVDLGEGLSEHTLAKVLGVSRTPVREALTALQQQGLIDIQPQRGSFVFLPSEADLDKLCEFRCMTEVQALRLCYQHRRAETLVALRAAANKMEAARKADDQLASAQADGEFHDALLENCMNEYLIDAYRLVSGKVAALRSHRSSSGTRQASNAEHRQIIAAFAAGNLARAKSVLKRHILSMRDRYRLVDADEVAQRRGRRGAKSAMKLRT